MLAPLCFGFAILTLSASLWLTGPSPTRRNPCPVPRYPEGSNGDRAGFWLLGAFVVIGVAGFGAIHSATRALIGAMAAVVLIVAAGVVLRDVIFPVAERTQAWLRAGVPGPSATATPAGDLDEVPDRHDQVLAWLPPDIAADFRSGAITADAPSSDQCRCNHTQPGTTG